MVEDRIDHFLVAVDNLQDTLGPAGLPEQLGQTHRHARVALARLEDEGIADRDGDAEHPHRDHRREIERGDPRADAKRLTHRIDVDPRPGALRVLAFQHVRNAAGKLDHVEPAHHVAARIGEDLAVLAGEENREFFEVGLDQPLELEHHPRAPLRVDRRPAGLRGLGGFDGKLELGLAAQRNFRLHHPAVGIENVAHAPACAAAGSAHDEVFDVAHSHDPFS